MEAAGRRCLQPPGPCRRALPQPLGNAASASSPLTGPFPLVLVRPGRPKPPPSHCPKQATTSSLPLTHGPSLVAAPWLHGVLGTLRGLPAGAGLQSPASLPPPPRRLPAASPPPPRLRPSASPRLRLPRRSPSPLRSEPVARNHYGPGLALHGLSLRGLSCRLRRGVGPGWRRCAQDLRRQRAGRKGPA